LISCESIDQHDRTINAQGIDANLALTEKSIGLDSISYANGNRQYMLKGEFMYDTSLVTYSIFLNANPFSDNFNIISHAFPLIDENELDNYECNLLITEDECAITWSKENVRLYIRDRIIAGH